MAGVRSAVQFVFDRYLHQVMVEGVCYDWCILLSVVLRDEALFSRSINLSTSLAESGDTEALNRLCIFIHTVSNAITCCHS